MNGRKRDALVPVTTRRHAVLSKKTARAPATPEEVARYKEGCKAQPSVVTAPALVLAPEVVQYFEERRKRRSVAKTTRTPSGQILDWIPVESQHPSGKIAVPPPSTSSGMRAADPVAQYCGFELNDPSIERGPKGTVPVLRKDFSKLRTRKSLRAYLSKVGPRALRRGDPVPADPDPQGYFHGSSLQETQCFGADGVLNVWYPYLENDDDHSIAQTALQNLDFGPAQSIEAGWLVSEDRYDDYAAHLFVYYTTNGYTDDGDNKGGYDQDVDGWVQYDGSIFPGALITGASSLGGGQRVIGIKYQLFEGNWWFQVSGAGGAWWIGYYPSQLFMGGGSVFNGLGNYADRVFFYGEVFTSNDDPNSSTTQMGSGFFAEAGWTDACYLSNLRVQTDKSGTMADFEGIPSAEDPQHYNMLQNMQSGSSWGSYMWVGGPGAGAEYRGVVLSDGDQNGYFLDGYGNVHELGNVPSPAPITGLWWNWNIARGIVLRGGGQSGYVLDGWGGLHEFGGAPHVDPSAYWQGWDIARGIVLRFDGQSGYVIDGWGGIHPWGGAPNVFIPA